MTAILAICVAVIVTVSLYLMLGRELKGVAMGVFLLGHAANLAILAVSGSPVTTANAGLKNAALTAEPLPTEALSFYVDPLPQALILTAIVIGFAVMGFLLTLLIVASRAHQTLEIDELAADPALRPEAPRGVTT
jgi:multicomponent Na+:H+ antiporter subunit C